MAADPISGLAADRKLFYGVRVSTPVGAAATTDVPEKAFYVDERPDYTSGGRAVATVTLTPDVGSVAVPASGTIFHTFSVQKYTAGAPTGGTPVGTFTTKTGTTALTTATVTLIGTTSTTTAGSNASGQAVVNVATGTGANFNVGDKVQITSANGQLKEQLYVLSIATDAITHTANLVNTYAAGATYARLDPKTLAPGDVLTYKTTHTGTTTVAFPATQANLDVTVA